MASHQIGAKPLPEAMLIYDHLQQSSMKYKTKDDNFSLRKLI